MSEKTKAAGVVGRGEDARVLKELVAELESRSEEFVLSCLIGRALGHNGAVPDRKCCAAWVACLNKIEAHHARMQEVSADELHAMAEAKRAGGVQ